MSSKVTFKATITLVTVDSMNERAHIVDLLEEALYALDIAPVEDDEGAESYYTVNDIKVS